MVKQCFLMTHNNKLQVNQKNLKSVGMTLKEQDGMTLAKVKEQDGMTLAKVKTHTEVPSIPTSAACHN